jgi:hypothetical protein
MITVLLLFKKDYNGIRNKTYIELNLELDIPFIDPYLLEYIREGIIFYSDDRDHKYKHKIKINMDNKLRCYEYYTLVFNAIINHPLYKLKKQEDENILMSNLTDCLLINKELKDIQDFINDTSKSKKTNISKFIKERMEQISKSDILYHEYVHINFNVLERIF